MITFKSEEDIKKLRASGEILVNVLGELKEKAKPGVSLSYLNNLAEKILEGTGGKSAFFGYKPAGARSAYPAHICTSVNDQVVHGIPSSYKLKDGDLLKIDLGVNLNGYITDAAITVPIGKISKDAKRLVKATETALKDAVKVIKPGNRLGDIGYVIEKRAKKERVSVLKNLTGHGVGFKLHEEPIIYNYGEKGTGLELKEGMVLAIEPMFSLGADMVVQRPDDSFGTPDGSLTAHFEATVAVTKRGGEMLTNVHD